MSPIFNPDRDRKFSDRKCSDRKISDRKSGWSRSGYNQTSIRNPDFSGMLFDHYYHKVTQIRINELDFGSGSGSEIFRSENPDRKSGSKFRTSHSISIETIKTQNPDRNSGSGLPIGISDVYAENKNKNNYKLVEQ